MLRNRSPRFTQVAVVGLNVGSDLLETDLDLRVPPFSCYLLSHSHAPARRLKRQKK